MNFDRLEQKRIFKDNNYYFERISAIIIRCTIFFTRFYENFYSVYFCLDLHAYAQYSLLWSRMKIWTLQGHVGVKTFTINHFHIQVLLVFALVI